MFRFLILKLQHPQNATKVPPIFSSLWQYGGGKAICSRVESPPSLPVSDPEKLLIISHLVSSCGLSPTAADIAAKCISGKTKERSVSVIHLLKSYGFSDAQIDSLAVKRSQLLVSYPEKTIKPKLDFLLSQGFSREEVADILTSNPTLLGRNLERGLVSTHRFLSSVLPSRSDVFRALKCGNQCLTVDNEPNINLLRANGVSESVILFTLTRFPMALMRSSEHLEEVVKKLIEMGFDPQKNMFAHALNHISYLSKATWLRKVNLLQELGWSEAEVFRIFKRLPSFICMSDEQLRFRVEFFTKSIGWDLHFISMSPALLQLSIEKRIVPRVSVLKLLMSKGLIKKKWAQIQFYSSEETFFGRYVERYAAVVPEIIQTYRGAQMSLLNG